MDKLRERNDIVQKWFKERNLDANNRAIINKRFYSMENKNKTAKAKSFSRIEIGKIVSWKIEMNGDIMSGEVIKRKHRKDGSYSYKLKS